MDGTRGWAAGTHSVAGQEGRWAERGLHRCGGNGAGGDEDAVATRGGSADGGVAQRQKRVQGQARRGSSTGPGKRRSGAARGGQPAAVSGDVPGGQGSAVRPAARSAAAVAVS